MFPIQQVNITLLEAFHLKKKEKKKKGNPPIVVTFGC